MRHPSKSKSMFMLFSPTVWHKDEFLLTGSFPHFNIEILTKVNSYTNFNEAYTCSLFKINSPTVLTYFILFYIICNIITRSMEPETHKG